MWCRQGVRLLTRRAAPGVTSRGVRPVSSFLRRHVGPSEQDREKMLKVVGVDSMKSLVNKIIPAAIQSDQALQLSAALTEPEFLARAKQVFQQNTMWRSYIGDGYYGCHVPSPIIRNVLENPGWYTQYTPYQAEISQGRLEMLFLYQTAIADFTGLEVANASLLDEASAAMEATKMIARCTKRKTVYVDERSHAAVIRVLQSDAEASGLNLIVCRDIATRQFDKDCAGIFVQYPNTRGDVVDWSETVQRVHAAGGMVICATDPLALALLKSPGDLGFDVAVGSAQRLGVPLFYGGPHAAFFACQRKHVKNMPGRLIGLSVDASGSPAYRLTLQTREQFIRKEKATSNICTAQALLANMTAMYCMYHGAEGLNEIASDVHSKTCILAHAIESGGHRLETTSFYDTLTFEPKNLKTIKYRATQAKINLKYNNDGTVSISLDETVTTKDLTDLVGIIGNDSVASLAKSISQPSAALSKLSRSTPYLTAPAFSAYRSETELMRYLKSLENRDLSLVHSMIPLGSCTMKLNAATELMPVSWPELNIHPYCPVEQARGFDVVVSELEAQLKEITGYDKISFQPRAGAQGEYAGLRVIRKYLASKGESHRDICIVPESAHGTNSASATVAGLRVKTVRNTVSGAIDMTHLRQVCEQNHDKVAAIMVTYPSTFGIFDEDILEICETIHNHGGQVYVDGANLNAQVGICRPAEYGSDVSHLNLHKTFCIPHGGGGPGSGPIGVKAHLAPFLPSDPSDQTPLADINSFGAVGSSRYGNSAILPISWAYICMMGPDGLRYASEMALLNANYMARRLENDFKILYRNRNGFCAHEFIIDCKPFKKVDITPTDIGKRLQDYGHHAPTVAWPYQHGFMVEPTESESRSSLDDYCDALLNIRLEIEDIVSGKFDKKDNLLKNAPHTLAEIVSPTWSRPYTPQQAAFPSSRTDELQALVQPRTKFWPFVSRIDDTYGDRHLVLTQNDA